MRPRYGDSHVSQPRLTMGAMETEPSSTQLPTPDRPPDYSARVHELLRRHAATFERLDRLAVARGDHSGAGGARQRERRPRNAGRARQLALPLRGRLQR